MACREGKNAKEFFMKKLSVSLAILALALALGLAFVGCDNETTGGGGGPNIGGGGALTITNIPQKYVGNYLYISTLVAENDVSNLLTCVEVNEDGLSTGLYQITSTSMTFPLWYNDFYGFKRYNGNGTTVYSTGAQIKNGSSSYFSDTLAYITWNDPITFANGRATISVNNAIVSE
jgi:hypothetical protein